MKTLGDILWQPIIEIIAFKVCKNRDDFTNFMQEWELEILAHLREKYKSTVINADLSKGVTEHVHISLADYVYKKRKINLVDLIPDLLKKDSALTVFDAEARAFENSKPDVSNIIQSITQH